MIAAGAQAQTPYESGIFTGEEPLRPGGLQLTAEAIRYCELQNGARVLDIGCGCGVSVEYLRELGFRAVGIDYQVRNPNCSLFVARSEATCLPIASESMDAALAECSLSLMDKKEEVLAECSRILKTNGRLAITDMYSRNPAGVPNLRALSNACVSGMIVREELEAQLEGAGFLIERWEDHSHVLKQLLFRILMAGETLDQLWTCEGTGKQEARHIGETVRAARPGYFLLVARKPYDDEESL